MLSFFAFKLNASVEARLSRRIVVERKNKKLSKIHRRNDDPPRSDSARALSPRYLHDGRTSAHLQSTIYTYSRVTHTIQSTSTRGLLTDKMLPPALNIPKWYLTLHSPRHPKHPNHPLPLPRHAPNPITQLTSIDTF